MTATIAQLVDLALRANGIPIVSVAIGDPLNRATWIVQFDPSATGAQQTLAAGIVAGVAVDAAAIHAQDDKDAQVAIDNVSIFEKAIVLALIDQLNVIRAALPVPLGAITPAQALASIRAKAGTL